MICILKGVLSQTFNSSCLRKFFDIECRPQAEMSNWHPQGFVQDGLNELIIIKIDSVQWNIFVGLFGTLSII